MYYVDRITGKRVWKYDLVDEVIAGASCGIHPTTGLDHRCIMFTIHLTSTAGHQLLCRRLFDTVELYFSDIYSRRRSASYCGLASFIDVNGSKFTGADRDVQKVHCHGFIFIPWKTKAEDVQNLIVHLERAAIQATVDGKSVVRGAPSAVLFNRFDRSRPESDLSTWVAYSQKEATRIATPGDNIIILPFDIRKEWDNATARHMECKRNYVLQKLKGDERFKIFRKPKSEKRPEPVC